MTKKNTKKTKKNQLLDQKRLIQKYDKLYQDGEYNKCLEILGNVTDQSSNERLIFLKSKVLYKQGKFESAITLLQKASTLNPEKIEYLSFTAQILEENNQLLHALTIYSKIFKIRPNDISSLRKMGMLLERLKRINQALVCYQKLLTLKQDDPDLSNASAAVILILVISIVLQTIMKKQSHSAEIQVLHGYWSEVCF